MDDPTVDSAPPPTGSRWQRILGGRGRRWVIGIVLVNLVAVLALAGIGSARSQGCGGGFSGYSGGGGSTCKADLIMNAYAAPSPAQVGQRLIYLFTARNRGPDSTFGVSMTIRIPKGLQINWWMSSAGEYGGGCQYQNRVVSCFFYDSLSRGEAVAATVVVVPGAKGTVRLTASAHSGATDPHPGNNNVAIKTVVQG
jgi:uncharacterized repeat protein (TIGR01451 family)